MTTVIRGKKGFTLIEMTIASAMSFLVLYMIMSIFITTLKQYKNSVETLADETSLTRFFATIEKDLRYASRITEIETGDDGEPPALEIWIDYYEEDDGSGGTSNIQSDPGFDGAKAQLESRLRGIMTGWQFSDDNDKVYKGTKIRYEFDNEFENTSPNLENAQVFKAVRKQKFFYWIDVFGEDEDNDDGDTVTDNVDENKPFHDDGFPDDLANCVSNARNPASTNTRGYMMLERTDDPSGAFSDPKAKEDMNGSMEKGEFRPTLYLLNEGVRIFPRDAMGNKISEKQNYNRNMLYLSAIRSVEIQTAHRTKLAKQDAPVWEQPTTTPDVRYNSYIINLRDLSLKKPPKI